jgi:UDP-N-acetyl-2-amino-2-deoxyglucuronate dehydrogenase
MTHYRQLQLADFLEAVLEEREPLVNAKAGRQVVERFTAVYRSRSENAVLGLPLSQRPSED